MKKLFAAAVTAVVLSACGGPLEDEQAQPQAKQAGLEATLVRDSADVQQLNDPYALIRTNAPPRIEERYMYNPFTGHGSR
jgi:hypothetical protein